MIRPLPASILLLTLLGLGACAPVFGTQSEAQRTAYEECEKEVDQAFLKQNPQFLFQQDNYVAHTKDAPNSTYGEMGVSGNGLGAAWDRNQALQNCLIQKGAPPQTPTVVPSYPVAP
jgi:hypothetical protein